MNLSRSMKIMSRLYFDDCFDRVTMTLDDGDVIIVAHAALTNDSLDVNCEKVNDDWNPIAGSM